MEGASGPYNPSLKETMSIEQAAAEVRELIPRVLQALHANNVWESVKSAEEITSSQFEDQPTADPTFSFSATLPHPPVLLITICVRDHGENHKCWIQMHASNHGQMVAMGQALQGHGERV